MRSFEECLAFEEYMAKCRERAARMRKRIRAQTREQRRQRKTIALLRLTIIVWAAVAALFVATRMA